MHTAQSTQPLPSDETMQVFLHSLHAEKARLPSVSNFSSAQYGSLAFPVPQTLLFILNYKTILILLQCIIQIYQLEKVSQESLMVAIFAVYQKCVLIY